MHELAQLGFAINNSFCHYTYTSSARYAFEGGQVGCFASFRNRRMKQAVQHRSYGYKNRIPDVYWGNSIHAAILSEEEKHSIRQVLTDDLVQEEAGNLMFTMSYYCKPYTVIPHHRRQKIRSLLMKYIV